MKLNFYLLSVKNIEEFCAYLGKISRLNIKKLILDIDQLTAFMLVVVISNLLKMRNLKTNLEELEIKSDYKMSINSFITNWGMYWEYAKLNQVTFTCDNFKSKDIFELKKYMEKYFREFRRYDESLICSSKN